MTREMLVQSIANTISTYRTGELQQPDATHVDRWASQFTQANQLAFLREFDHVIKQTFLTEATISSFIDLLATNPALTGNNPADYWSKANVLNIQKVGLSQRSMVGIFERVIQSKFGIANLQTSHPEGEFIYLDDVIFTGTRIGNDLSSWIETSAPQVAKLHIVVAGWHLFGRFGAGRKIDAAIAASKKKIEVHFWSIERFRFEDRKYYRINAQVLVPSAIPDSQVVRDYLAQETKYPLQLRPLGGQPGIFSSEAARSLLESEFLIAGASIRSRGSMSNVWRPLGFGYFGVGFGGLVVTHRNCPNNCPLAMWWGDPTKTTGALAWYPLLARDGNSSAKNVFSRFS